MIPKFNVGDKVDWYSLHGQHLGSHTVTIVHDKNEYGEPSNVVYYRLDDNGKNWVSQDNLRYRL